MNMTPTELKAKWKTELKQQGVHEIDPLHDAMMDECCENVLKTSGQTDEVYLSALRIGFLAANATLTGLLNASLTKADTVTLNYRGQTFTIDKN